jgi:cellulose synthase/poly-beta-1,6-N-acetylglucosamine synthase-like glycosyltransferase
VNNWMAGVITVSAIILGIALQSFITRNVGVFQGTLLLFSYYGIITMIMCLLFRQKKSAMNEFYRPFVSIIIPAKNEEMVIEGTVRSVAGLNYRKNNKANFEILVVDDNSTDNTFGILEGLSKEIPALRPLKRTQGNKGKSAVLNYALSQSRGEVVAVFDADTRVEPDFLKKTVPCLYEEKIAGVQGRVRICNAQENMLTQLQEDEFASFAHALQISKDIYGGTMILAGNGQVTKRSAVEEAGGWNELSSTDDMDLTIKFLLKGKIVRYLPDAVVWQEGITTIRPLIRQRMRWAEGMLKCLFDYFYPLLVTREATWMQKIDALAGLARITLPMGIWVGYGHLFFQYGMSWEFHSSLPQICLDTLPWLFLTSMAACLLKYTARPGLDTLLRVPIYWAYNFFWVLAVPVGYLQAIKNMGRIEWDKTEHRGSVKAAADAGLQASSSSQ